MNEQKTEKKGLSFALRNLFGVGDGAFVLMSNVETFYFMTFLTDLAGFTPAIAGVINSVFSIVDACLSWIYGGILNGTKAKKWGRYRSWMILTPWIVPFIFAFQFIRVSENEVLAAVVITAAAIISHVIWNIGYVANSTLVAVVGKTPEEKAALASSRATWNNIGGLVWSYAGLPFATLLAGVVGKNNMWAATAFVLGIVMVLGYFAHFKMTEGYEEIEDPNAKITYNKVNVPEMFKSLFQNPQLLVLIIADLAKWCVKFATGAAAIYYFRDAAGNAGLMVPYALAIAIGAIVGAYSVRLLIKKFDNRTVLIISYTGMAIFLFLVYACYANATLVIIMMTLAQFFYGMALGTAPACYADTVVYASAKTGKNASGWIMGLQNVPLKVAVFLRGVIISACLVAVGWKTGVLLEGTARQGMTVAFGLVPCIFCVVGLLLLVFLYKLTNAKIAEYQAQIDAARE